MWDKACYHFHTHPKKTKPCCQAAPELVSFTLSSFYSLFWPQLPGSPCDVSPLHMPLRWIRCCLRHCSRRDMTEQEHAAAGLCNILWKGAEQGWDCYCSSAKGWAGQKLCADNAQSILLWAVVPIKPNMKMFIPWLQTATGLRCSQWLSHIKIFPKKGAVGAVSVLHLFLPHSWQNSFPVWKFLGAFAKAHFCY